MSNKKLFIKTYGCQMNVYDSARIGEVLAPLGYAETDCAENADMIIMNTCHIREKAAEKVYSDIGRFRALKESRLAAGKGTIIAVGGCVAQAEGEEITRRAPAVDLVFGPQNYHRLPAMLTSLQEVPGRAVVETEFPADDKFGSLPANPRPGRASAFLTIQEGCDKFCTFCVVPYTRGSEFSRPVRAVVAEARQLVKSGVREITLLGQNVNAYHGEGPEGKSWTLGRLLTRLAEIDGLDRLRYTTSHPRDVDEELVAAHRDIDKLMPFLHLPVQSGSDRILRAMNRGHTADDYRKIAEKLRKACGDLVLSSDFIVGFPGESDADFEATMQLVGDVGFAQAFSFKYSARPGTPAADADDQLPDAVKSERLQRLQTELQKQQRDFNERCIGTRQKVLFDRPGRYKDQLVGRSPFMQPVHVSIENDAMRKHLLNHIREVEIEAALPNSLAGRLVEEKGDNEFAMAS